MSISKDFINVSGDEVKIQARRRKGDAFETREFQVLQQGIAKLSETQKIALITPTNQQKTHRTEPRVLDILMAKKVLYSLIDHPSLEVKTGYCDLKALLNLEEMV